MSLRESRLRTQESEDPKALVRELSGFKRDPFIRELSRFLLAKPTMPKIRTFAGRYPDRWAQGVMILAKLSGFSEKIDLAVTGSIAHVHLLSDVELEKRIKHLQVVLSQPQVIETSVAENQTSETSTEKSTPSDPMSDKDYCVNS